MLLHGIFRRVEKLKIDQHLFVFVPHGAPEKSLLVVGNYFSSAWWGFGRREDRGLERDEALRLADTLYRVFVPWHERHRVRVSVGKGFKIKKKHMTLGTDRYIPVYLHLPAGAELLDDHHLQDLTRTRHGAVMLNQLLPRKQTFPGKPLPEVSVDDQSLSTASSQP